MRKLTVIFALCLALFLDPTSAQWTAYTGTLTDNPSDNIGSPLPLANLTMCQIACALNQNCIAFAIGLSTATTQCVSSPCCFLKSTLTIPAKNSCSKGPCYSFSEDPISHRCSSDCECDSTRTCSTYGYCQGSSTTCSSAPAAPAPTSVTLYLSSLAIEVVNSNLPRFFKLQGFVDSPGHDISDFASGTLTACSQRCSTTLGCNGFVYVGSAYTNLPNHCWLKSSIVLPLATWQQDHGLDPSIPAQRAVGVVYQTSVITGDYSTYQNLDPDYQRFTANTWGSGSPPSSNPFVIATGCGTSDNPDLVTEICMHRSYSWKSSLNQYTSWSCNGCYNSCQASDNATDRAYSCDTQYTGSIGCAGSSCHQPYGCQCWHYWKVVDAFKITFESGFYLVCTNGLCSINGPAGASLTKTSSGVQCIELNPTISERVLSATIGLNGPGTSNELYGVHIKTNAESQDLPATWPSSITEVNTGNYLLDGTNISFSAPTKSIAQLQSNLLKYSASRREDLYSKFLDGTTSSGFLCGAGLSYTSNVSVTDSTGTSRLWSFTIKQLGLLFMHPIAPINGYDIKPFTVITANTQPVQNSDSITVVSRSNDIPCSGPGNGYSAVNEQFSVSKGTSWSLSGSQQKTFGENLGNQWSVSSNVQIGSTFNPILNGQVNIQASYASIRTSTFQATTSTSTSSSGGLITNTNVNLPFVCPKGPNYNRGIQCTFSAGAAYSTSFSQVPWSSSGVFTLISGKQFEVPIGGVVSGQVISDAVQIYSVECEGVFYSSSACQRTPGSIIQCAGQFGAQYYTTQQAYNSRGFPSGIIITDLPLSNYSALGSPQPNAILDTCAEIQEGCGNLVTSNPPSPMTPPSAPPTTASTSTQSFSQVQVTSYSQMLLIARSFNSVSLLVGTGYDAPFSNVSSVLATMMPYLQAIQNQAGGQPWLLIWPGSQPTTGSPWFGPGRIPSMAADVKYLVAQIKQLFNVQIMVVASDGYDVNICDYCFLVPPSLQQLDPSTNATIYAGAHINATTSQMVLLGGTRYYLSADLVGSINSPGIIKSMLVAGGGNAQLQELQYASGAGIKWRYFPSQPPSAIDLIMPVLMQNDIATIQADGSYCGNC